MDDSIESNKIKTPFRPTNSSTVGKKNKKRPFSYIFLFIGSVLAIHITFLWSQQEFVDVNSIQLKSSPNSVDKSFDLSITIPQVEKFTEVHNQTSNSSHINNEKQDGKQRIIQILEASGMNVTDEIYARLPSWDLIESMYGSSPVIHGLDTCGEFQQRIPRDEAYIGPAGTFNTGTNLLADLLPKYCSIDSPEKKRSGMLWQVPWGKHNPVSWRYRNIAIGGKDVKDQGTVLPVVTIKDPYSWMGSMCRNSYAAHWPVSKDHCPNLVLNEVDRAHNIMGDPDTGRVTVNVHYKDQNVSHYDTLVGFWNDWYGDYLAIKEFPRLIVRYEDVLFHTTQVVQQICQCGGGKMKTNDTVSLLAASAKGSEGAHAGANGLLAAIIRYGNPSTRVEHMTRDDIDFAGSHLRKDLMSIFRYKYAR